MPKVSTHYTKDVDRKLTDPSKTRYSEKQKYEAVALYKMLGSLPSVCKATGISLHTLKNWHVQDWWKEYEHEVTHEGRVKLTGKLARIRDSAMKVVEDRLENGDFHYDQKLSKIIRKPVNAHVANKIMNDTVDRSVLLEKLNTEAQVRSSHEKIADRLLKLHEDFARMAHKNYGKDKDIIDAEVIEEETDALSEEREAGLQDGKREVQVETRTDQEEGRTEPS